jgi:hypothetical protein
MKFREGDFVVTHDYRRGFVLRAGHGAVATLMATSLKVVMYSENLLDLSGVEPTDEECAAFARYHLTGSVKSD